MSGERYRNRNISLLLTSQWCFLFCVALCVCMSEPLPRVRHSPGGRRAVSTAAPAQRAGHPDGDGHVRRRVSYADRLQKRYVRTAGSHSRPGVSGLTGSRRVSQQTRGLSPGLLSARGTGRAAVSYRSTGIYLFISLSEIYAVNNGQLHVLESKLFLNKREHLHPYISSQHSVRKWFRDLNSQNKFSR